MSELVMDQLVDIAAKSIGARYRLGHMGDGLALEDQVADDAQHHHTAEQRREEPGSEEEGWPRVLAASQPERDEDERSQESSLGLGQVGEAHQRCQPDRVW